MPNTKPKRDPLASAPTSQEIMSGARRRTHEQHTSIPAQQKTSRIWSEKRRNTAATKLDPKPPFTCPPDF